MAQTFIKDPQAVLDYKFDWSTWLGDVDTISSATVTPSSGLTLDGSSVTDSNTTVTAWLSGGTAGASYSAVCHIATVQGRQDDRTITIVVAEK